MRRAPLFVVSLATILVAALAVALRAGPRWFPLGVPGEWEWSRLDVVPSALAVGTGLVGVAFFSGFAALGFRSLSTKAGKGREAAWLVGLALAAPIAQGLVQEGAPEGYGLSKWILALHAPGSSGYYTVAKDQMGDTRQFLLDYPDWIKTQDALHVGTHPPGLFLLSRSAIGMMGSHPNLARSFLACVPPSVGAAVRLFRETRGLSREDAGALALIGALTLLACSWTVVPLYLLARASLPAPSAWVAASLWPLVPSALLFQPTADTAFPLLSTSALALAAWAKGGRWPCFASGLVLALGMAFTLAFLPVGLVVALVLATARGSGVRDRVGGLVVVGLGFLAGTLAFWAMTSANPFAIWWTNQRNHARFYVEYPRSYGRWVAENPVELAVGLGLPVALWAVVGSFSRKDAPRVAWATLFVLAALTISGKNLSEVARLWIPLMPPLLVASGSGFARIGAGARSIGATIALVGLQTLILEATIQVVYSL